MRYTLSFQHREYERLMELLKANPGVENAAYMLCRLSRSANETRLLVREILPVLDHHVKASSQTSMRIACASFVGAIKAAHNKKCAFVFAHSHPPDFPLHSEQDDTEERQLFRTAYNRIHNDSVHASIVISDDKISSARVCLPDGSMSPIDTIRVIGRQIKFHFPQDDNNTEILQFFDRQIRAFGANFQSLLGRLKIGIVGAGGTGSLVIEQLTRLGVGHLIIADGEHFEVSNINRLYGSRVIDSEIKKVKIAERSIAYIGLSTVTEVIAKPITFESAMSRFRECDFVFGCTDDEWGRSLLSRLSIYYLIPIFDMGVRIDSENQTIRSIDGRVTTLMPGAPCLFCRGRISAERIGHEVLRATNPDAALHQQREGYIPELADPAPAVIPFTTSVGAAAVMEFMHRLTGFMGAERDSSETLLLLDRSTVRRNNKQSLQSCFCGDESFWGRGDVKPMLDTTWRAE